MGKNYFLCFFSKLYDHKSTRGNKINRHVYDLSYRNCYCYRSTIVCNDYSHTQSKILRRFVYDTDETLLLITSYKFKCCIPS